MPHCIIEYAKKLEEEISPSSLIQKVYEATLRSNLFIANDIKTRAIAYDNYQTAEKKSNFIHITIKILSGRSIEEKSLLSSIVIDEFRNIDQKNISITVEISEIETQSYSKLIL